jgi:hypothetical protein
MEDVAVEVGGPAPFATLYPLITMPGVDPAKPVHPLWGSWTWSVCMLRADAARGGKDPGLNCRETPVGDATGGCWRTTFGDWKCAMNGRSGATVAPTRPRRAG